jgi:hypothetical protein
MPGNPKRTRHVNNSVAPIHSRGVLTVSTSLPSPPYRCTTQFEFNGPEPTQTLRVRASEGGANAAEPQCVTLLADGSVNLLACVPSDAGQVWAWNPFSVGPARQLLLQATLECLTLTTSSVLVTAVCEDPPTPAQLWTLDADGTLAASSSLSRTMSPISVSEHLKTAATACVQASPASDNATLSRLLPCFQTGLLSFSPQAPHPPGSRLGVLPLSFGGAVSLAAWVRTATGTRGDAWSRVLDLGNGAPGDNVLLSHDGTQGTMAYQVYVGDSQLPTPPAIQSSDPIPEGSWLHVVVVHAASGDASMYWGNGSGVMSLQAQGPVLLPAQGVPRASNFIGVSNWPQDTAFTGAIAGVRVYNRALELEEVQVLGAEAPPSESSSNVIAVSAVSVAANHGHHLSSASRTSASTSTSAPTSASATNDASASGRSASTSAGTAGAGPVSSGVNLCVSRTASFSLNVTATQTVFDEQLLGHDLEFTRHDLFAGLSSELVANRKFAVPTPCDSSGSYSCWPTALQDLMRRAGNFAPRWTALGSAELSAPWYGANVSAMVTGDRGHSVACQATAADEECGVQQGGEFDGFEGGMSWGSAIALQQGQAYEVRLVMRADTTAVIVARLTGDAGAPLWTATVPPGSLPANGSWATVSFNFSAAATTLNATLTVRPSRCSVTSSRCLANLLQSRE